MKRSVGLGPKLFWNENITDAAGAFVSDTFLRFKQNMNISWCGNKCISLVIDSDATVRRNNKMNLLVAQVENKYVYHWKSNVQVCPTFVLKTKRGLNAMDLVPGTTLAVSPQTYP